MPSALIAAYVPTSGSLAWRVTANSVTETVSQSVTSGREYWPTGDSRTDSADGDGDFFSVLEGALLLHSEITTASVTLVQGRIRITCDVATSILWTDAATTAEAWPWGFLASADSDSGTIIDAPNTCPLVWLPGVDISDDSRDRQRLIRARASSLSGLVYTSNFGNGAKARRVGWRLVNQDRILEEYAGASRTAWETIDRRGIGDGVRVRVYDDASTITSGNGFASYRVDSRPAVERDAEYQYRWAVDLGLRAEGLDAQQAEALTWSPATGAHVSVSPGNYVSLNNPTVLNGAAAMTVSYWMRNSDALPTRGAIISRGTQWQTEERNSTAEAWFVVGTSGEFTGSVAAADDGTWHQWIWVYDGGNVTLYIDGAEVTTSVAGTVPTSLGAVTADLTLGHTGATGSATAGTHDLARLAVWTSAANASQAAEIYTERRDIADGASLGIGQPEIWMTLADLVVEGNTGGTASAVGSPVFVSG